MSRKEKPRHDLNVAVGKPARRSTAWRNGRHVAVIIKYSPLGSYTKYPYAEEAQARMELLKSLNPRASAGEN